MLAVTFRMQTAIEAQVLLVVATIGLALLLPSEARIQALAGQATPVTWRFSPLRSLVAM
jgi:hypothetical protein